MNIAIIGAGYVGLVTGVCLAHIGHTVVCVDNNKDKGIVRLPNSVAMSLAVKQWQDPAKARAELLERAAKAFFVPPPPPEPKSAFE